MKLRQLQARFAVMTGMLLVYAAKNKWPMVILELYRSEAQQRVNVAKGVSKTMNSMHLKGLAIDICFLDDIMDDGVINYPPDRYKELGEYWESLGGRWGGRFGDDPKTVKIEGWDAGHFELPIGDYNGVLLDI